LVDATLGTQTVIAAGGATTVQGGANISVSGGAGPLQFAGNDDLAGGAAGATVIAGSGSLYAFNLGNKAKITGSTLNTTLIDDSYGKGGSGILTGGRAASTILGGNADSIVGGQGTLQVGLGSNISGATVDLTAGGRGPAAIRDNSVIGASGGTSTVNGFNTLTDLIAAATSSPTGTFLGSSKSDGSGGTILTFLDGSTMDIAGVASVSSIKFTA